LRRQKLEYGILFVIGLYVMWAVYVKRVMADERKKTVEQPSFYPLRKAELLHYTYRYVGGARLV